MAKLSIFLLIIFQLLYHTNTKNYSILTKFAQNILGVIMKFKKTIFIVFIFVIAFITCGCSMSFLPNFDNDNNQNQTFESTQIDTSKISSYQDLVAVCKPAVVGIVSTYGRYQSIGSGVCIKNGAYVLTNNHVIENGGRINLYLSDGSTATATVAWTDPSSDLAMLKSSKNIPYLPVASAGSYQSGDEVIAIGTPIDIAFKHSVTKGIISAVNRTVSVDNESGTSTLYNLIQHDASINPGNSGGPLINTSGQVVGINTLKVTDAEGLGFAIPVDTFLPVVEKLNANGVYDTTYMGVFGYDNQLKNIGRAESGFYVASVAKNSPAENCGIKRGNIITQIDGKKIDFAKDLKTALYEHNVGEIVTVTYIENREVKLANIKLEKHPYSYSKKVEQL